MLLFSKETLLAGARMSCVLELAVAATLFVMGCVLVASNHYHLALGSRVGSSGGGLIFLSLLYPIPAWFTFKASQFHNKFMLLVHIVLVCGIVTLQLIVGGTTFAIAVPTFAYDVAAACLVDGHLNNATFLASCQAYFQSDEYAGLSLAWQTYYNESLGDASAGQALAKLQDASYCCGLGPPEHCQSEYYPATPLCYKGGSCAYDFPMGSCGLVGVAGQSMGCATAFHQYFASTIKTVGAFVLALTSLPMLFVVLSLCLVFKRKDEDVLPTMSYAWRSRARVYVAADIRRMERMDL
ncbi:Aste57867_12720 [Aphanomyces stellatus]|uniref:Aste57867_12720 protein n=1 Tax=Aphanomyces stellatus TaxID=120398 RepID=A0A485KWZ1_9STRA|nr:hypothetical protein As57867_012672 [Aphanomyces stellatus]VFT89570.1 Aste57867_12720 [Aphanomyces stellatus]